MSTVPDTFALFTEGEPFDGSVRIEFSERISERTAGGSMDDAVEVSPRTGEVSVGHRRSSIDVSVEGGFVQGVVYRITVLPVIRDMFGNSLREPFEFFFSTGPDFTDNALAGLIEDRITGQPVPGARVDAWQEGGDSIVHTTVTDDQGIFALRRLPDGEYRVRAYVDVNRTYEPDFIEVQGRETAPPLSEADTALVFLSLLQPDTTPAQLVSAEPLDSMTVELGFDDFLDPDVSLAGVDVGLAPDSLEEATDTAPAVVRLMHPHEFQAYTDSMRAVRDSLAALAVEEDSAAPSLPRGPSAPPAVPDAFGPREDDRMLPAQRIMALLENALVPSARYRVRAEGVPNINGVPNGGGEARLTAPEPPPPDTVAADSIATGDEVPDSAAAGDTVPAERADSAAAPPDSTPATADTVAHPPDAARDRSRILGGRAPPAETALARLRLRRLRE